MYRYTKNFLRIFVLTEYGKDWHQYTTSEGLKIMIAEDKTNSTYRWIDSSTLECTTYEEQGNISAIFEYHERIWIEHQFKPRG